MVDAVLKEALPVRDVDVQCPLAVAGADEPLLRRSVDLHP